MNVKKRYNEGTKTYDIILEKDQKKLKFIFGANGDLYWVLISEKLEDKKKDSFEITKENYEIYQYFDQLYHDIATCNLFEVADWKLEFCDTEEEKRKIQNEVQERNLSYQKRENYQKLFPKGTITWHSDEEMYDHANIVRIKKQKEKYIVEFQEQEILPEDRIYHIPGRKTIRFRNSGSMYDPFNIIFMRMFNNMQELDLNYHQIHIEEYLYHKNKVKTKK